MEKIKKIRFIHKSFNKLPNPIKNYLKILKRKYSPANRSIKNVSSENVQKSVVVFGVPRSGTSLTGNILDRLGIYMSEDEHVAMEGNIQGFFESGLFANMDNKILALAGGVWNKLPLEENILKLKNNDKLNNEIKELIKSQEKALWGWKGTRTSLTADLYHPFLKNPYYIICYRNFLSTAKSIEKGGKIWGKITIERSMRLALEYNKRILNFLSRINSPVLFVSYEGLLYESEKEVLKIKNFLGIKKDIDLGFINKKFKTC